MQTSIRAFIAVEINDAVRAKLAATQDALKEADAHVSWVKPPNIHGTFVFLGDIFANMVEPVAAALNQAASAYKPVEIEIAGLGFFGSPRSPRIVWAGMVGEVAPLMELQGKIVAAMLTLGLQPDQKPFTPHLTIGRVRSNRNAVALVDALKANETRAFGKVTVERVVLMQSTLTAQGPEYALLQPAVLSGERLPSRFL